MVRWKMAAALLSVVTAGACDQDTSGPQDDAARISFTQDGTTRTFAGAPAATVSGSFERSFVAARADSLDGIVAVGFAPAAGGTGDLFVLQAPRAIGAHACGDAAGTPCHGRYILGVTVSSTATYERFFNVVSGSVTFTQIGPDHLRGTFSLTLRATDDGPDGTIEIRNGTLDVPYVADPSTARALECLLARAAVAGMACGQAEPSRPGAAAGGPGAGAGAVAGRLRATAA